MIYTALTKKALRLSFDTHKDQVDKSGLPYVFHPFHLAEQMDDEYSICVALLHDVVEDSDVTIDDIRDAGFPEAIVKAILALTHKEEIPYFEYIEQIKANKIAAKVKAADLKHNMDLTRLESPTEKDVQRAEKYRAALEILLRETP